MAKFIKWDGKPISRNGAYSDVGMSEYHGGALCAGPSISSSGLRTIWSKSLKHYYKDSPLNPNRKVKTEERPHFSLGKCAHHLLFVGREKFDEEFRVRPPKWDSWRPPDAQKWRAEQIHRGRTVVTDDELEKIVGMARSLAAHPLIRAGILDGAVERSLAYKDPETGVWLLSRPDCIPNDSGDYSDMKLTRSVADEDIARTIDEYGYHMQAALTAKASKHVLDLEMQSFSLVWVENVEPYSVRVTSVPPEDLIRGRMQIEAATRMFAEALETGEWYGPGGEQTDAEYLGLRDFARKRIDAKLEALKGRYPPRYVPE